MRHPVSVWWRGRQTSSASASHASHASHSWLICRSTTTSSCAVRLVYNARMTAGNSVTQCGERETQWTLRLREWLTSPFSCRMHWIPANHSGTVTGLKISQEGWLQSYILRFIKTYWRSSADPGNGCWNVLSTWGTSSFTLERLPSCTCKVEKRMWKSEMQNLKSSLAENCTAKGTQILGMYQTLLPKK